MADKVAFELVAPERLLASVDADMVVIPAAEGDLGVLPDHAPVLALLRPGVIAVYEADRVTERVFVAGGFAEINERGCVVLAEAAQRLDEIDGAAAADELREAEAALAAAEAEDAEQERLTRRVDAARARVEATARS